MYPPESGRADAGHVREETASSLPGTDQELPFAGAPKVDDTKRFQSDPCQALTGDLVRCLAKAPTGKLRKDAPLGRACTWTNPDTGAEVEIHFLDKDPRGLSAQYQTKDRYAYFDELPPIEGYPAIAAAVADDRSIGLCMVSVGASDETTFIVPIRLSQVNIGTKDPCDVAAMVAGKALQTMKKN
ncbi:DUF3558 domain-containing protein [Actinophytocola sp.]|uniref:DUF3558 domain-containing protein n=1 Tax=Actinophytocola sp. TaxID=1872138 RepID=UPI002D23F609|nr:DUF3558 domain-containing protein [Actinophytocola sp.]HYQ67192.1 DUF3558 domain-containing protein [Actinophytocola sp.]